MDRTGSSARPTVADLDHVDLWSGTYRDVKFEVVRWTQRNPETERWNCYLYIPEWQVPADKWPLFDLEAAPCTISPLRKLFHLSSSPILSNLPMNGSPTYYSKGVAWDGSRYIKVGGDYGHDWDVDDSHHYIPRSVEYVMADCMRAIDELWTLVPDLKTVADRHAEIDAAIRAAKAREVRSCQP